MRIVFLFAVWALPGFAESVTLDQAIGESLEKNLDLIAERQNISIAGARMITAKLRPNPVLSLSGDHLDLLGTGYDLKNNGGPAEFAMMTTFVLERGAKRERRIDLAAADRSVAELAVMNTLRGIIFDVQRAFVDVQAARESVNLAQENLNNLSGIVSINEARVKSGDLAKVEFVRSQVAALQFRNAVQQAQLRLRQAKTQLQFLMGRMGQSADFDVAAGIRRDPSAPPVEELRAAAMEKRPDLQGLQKSQVRSGLDLRLQMANGIVDYSIGSEFRRQQGLAGTGNSLGFFFNVPIPVFNRNQGEIERARREQAQWDSRINALKTRIASEVATAYQQYTTSRELLEAIEKTMLDKAREVRDTTEYSYRRGEASLVEFLDAQRAFNETMQSYNDARADYARSLYQIDSIVGRTVNP